MVSLELSGPASLQTIELRPNDIRGMAGYVIDDCVRAGGGQGGFVTGLLQGMIDYALDPSSRFPYLPYRKYQDVVLK